MSFFPHPKLGTVSTIAMHRAHRAAVVRLGKICKWCWNPITAKRRREWCSDECVESYRLLADWKYCRSLVYKRDRGVCAICGVDTDALQSELRQRPGETKTAFASRLTRFGIPDGRAAADWWDADHIVPRSHGGSNHPSNLRTLCIMKCHPAETARLRREKELYVAA